MEAIEFKTKVRNGNIRIPEKYKHSTGNFVKVIIISEQETKQADIIDELLDNPLQIKDFFPFLRKDIYERL